MAGEASRQNGKLGGRPISPKTKAKAEAEALFIREAQKHIPTMVQALIDAATGAWTAVEKDGEIVRVYKKPPETQALKEYFDRVMGKANQQVSLDVTTKGKSVQAAAIEQITNEIDDEEEAEIEKAYDEVEKKVS